MPRGVGASPETQRRRPESVLPSQLQRLVSLLRSPLAARASLPARPWVVARLAPGTGVRRATSATSCSTTVLAQRVVVDAVPPVRRASRDRSTGARAAAPCVAPLGRWFPDDHTDHIVPADRVGHCRLRQSKRRTPRQLAGVERLCDLRATTMRCALQPSIAGSDSSMRAT